MKHILVLALLLCSMPYGAYSDTTRASLKLPMTESAAISETYADIRSTLGIIPDFFKGYPAESLPGAWRAFKGVQLNPQSAIPCRYKELIGLAVASQVPCHYCTFFHTTAAKLNGAEDPQIKEAIAIASQERAWSTFFTGTGTDLAEFKSFTDRFVARAKKGEVSLAFDSRPAASPEEAYKEMEAAFGEVPFFIKQFPREGVAGAWSDLKMLSFNPNTAIPAKYKDLISLAVSAQTPCTHCVYFDTETARLDGASEDEINEAVAMASMSRQWSTVLNGLQTNDAQFKKQMNQVFAFVKKQSQQASSNKG